MINHAMFQRNDRAGYVLKPLPLRSSDKSLLAKRSQHFLDITVCTVDFYIHDCEKLTCRCRSFLHSNYLAPRTRKAEKLLTVQSWTRS